MKIKLIVGLANPSTKYAITRHNAGAWYVDLLAARYNILLKEEIFCGYTGLLTICNYNVRLLVPNTFMNLSGKAVATMSKFYSITPEEILVAHDELDLKPGYARLKFGVGHNGHNGLKDIISRLGNNKLHSLRIGIGRRNDEKNIIKFVLNKPSFFDKKLINSAIYEAVRYTDIIIKDTIKAMSSLHALKIIDSSI